MPIDYARIFRENPNPVSWPAAIAAAVAAERAATAATAPPGAQTPGIGNASRWETPGGPLVTPEGARTEPDTSSPPPSATGATKPERKPPFPEPKNEYERARNAEDAIQWAIEDLQADLAKLDPEMTSARDRIRDNIRDAQTRLTAQQGLVRQAKADLDAAAAKGPKTIQKQEKGPDGRTYVVTYDVDAKGNEKWNGEKPVALDLGTRPGEAVELATAEVNLNRARAQLAEATSPEARRKAQIEVAQAELALEQARAKAPVELATAQLAYDRARLAYENESDPVAKETRRVALEQAKVALAQAQQTLNKPTETTVDGYLVRVTPSGEVTRVDTLTPEQRALKDEQTELAAETARRGTLPANAYAAYTQERSRLQEAGKAEIARLQELQRQGTITAQQAQTQFQQWLGPRQSQLQGLQAQAEEAQRAERTRVEELQRAEDARVEALNRQREAAGLAAGEGARQTWTALAPQVRTPQFMEQYGGLVERMAQRAAAPSAEAAAALPRGTTFTKETFNPANFRGAIPDLNQVSREATERALAAISPAIAQRIGLNLPQLPQGDGLTSLMNGVNYAGPLLRPPPGAVPLPGMEAQDLGTGLARTTYPGGAFSDWRIGA